MTPVRLALVADYANVTAEGKLNIMGIFDRIRVDKLPAVHPTMQFVLQLQVPASEADRAHTVEIKLHDPDGQTIFDIKGELVPRGAPPVGSIGANQIIGINNLQFSVAGLHNFVVFVDSNIEAEVPLLIEQASDRRTERFDA